jgi:hypothetical protein
MNGKIPVYISILFSALIWAVPSEAVYDAWAYKVKININNPGASRTDYPVRIEVPAKAYIDAGRMNSDMRDVRFSQGANELPFWIHISEGMQRKIGNIPVYVKVKTFNAGDNAIYMHFDNAKNENNSPPGGFHCGYHRTSPFSANLCGDAVFGSGLYSFDYRDYVSHIWQDCGVWVGAGASVDWSAISGFYWVSRKASKFQNSFILHYRYHLNITNEWKVYLLTDANASAPDIDSQYKGYKVFVDYVSSGGLFGNYKIIVYKRTAVAGAWSDISAGGFNWTPYNNSIQDFDFKVTASKIQVLVNGTLVGEVNRADDFNGGHVGFYSSDVSGGECDSYSTHTISPIWVLDNYTGSEPAVTFMGNADLEMKRAKPTADAAFTGNNVIENTARTQILDDTVDGNTMEQYLYSAYPLASLENQVFQAVLKVKNRGASADTFSISLAANDLNAWYIAYKYDGSGLLFTLPTNGSCAATLTAGCVDLAGGAQKDITIFIMPSDRALFESGSGKLALDFSVNGASDLSFDKVKYVFNIRGKTGCYWKWKLPITVNYNDTNNTGDLVDYQVLVNLSSVTEFSDALANGEDIVFSDSSGSKIPYWIKSFNKAAGTGSFWVKVPKVNSGAPGATTINMWWGNADCAAGLSNKKATFDMWEDWEGRTAGEVVGCPDGTADCAGQAVDTGGWTNNPDTQDNKDWWRIVTGQLNGKSVQAQTTGSSDYGPILSGGDVRWKNYEALYTHRKNDSGTNAYYDPVLYSDPGNMWGVEYYSNKFIFRPSTYGTDWTWVYQTTATAVIPDATFPVLDGTYRSKIRVFKAPNGNAHLKILSTRSGGVPADIDSDANFYSIADFHPDPILSLDSGAIGFSGWSGGFSFDDIRVRQYTEPEPTVAAAGAPVSVNYSPVSSLTNPYLSPPLLNGRALLTTAKLVPFKWLGNLTAIYADCYISGDCQAGENQSQPGTISLWGKIDNDTPKGFGDLLTNVSFGDENRASIDATPGNRYIFTAREAGSSPIGNCADATSGDCLAFAVSNASVLRPLLGASSQAEAENLVRFARGAYISGYPRSTVRDQTPFDGTKQWKLGDVVHSNPLLVGIPNMAYADADYGAFALSNNGRNLMAYFLSNEGALHAVRVARYDSALNPARYVGDTSAKELWAYVPNAALPRIKETTDIYHEYTADGLLRAIDIKSGGSYKTVMVGGLRTGGAALFAMNITNPSAPKLMWEINEATHSSEFANIGETYSAPALGRLCESETSGVCSGGRWVGILGSGFASNDIVNLGKNAYVSVIDLENGSVIKQIKVSAKPGNITTDMAVIRDSRGFIKKIVFGDYYGAVWRLDLTARAKVAAFLDASNTQLADADMLFKPADYETSDINAVAPVNNISAEPTLGIASSGQLWVYVGTGIYNLYAPAHPYQYFFALKDRAGATPYQLADLADMTASASANAAKSSWYVKLGITDALDKKLTGTSTNVTSSTKDRNERILNKAEVFGGFVFFNTFTPLNVPCGGGVTRFYSVSYETGSAETGLMLFSADDTGVTGTRSVALSQTGGISSAPMVHVGRDGSGQVAAAGLINSSTSGLEKINMASDKFTETPVLLFWREMR